MDPNQGRFTTRDTIGIWGDPLNMGNGYTFVGNNPMTLVDPFGLDQLVIHTTRPDYTNFTQTNGFSSTANSGMDATINNCECEYDPFTGHIWIEYIYEDENGNPIRSETYGLWLDDSSTRWPNDFYDIPNEPGVSDLRKGVENDEKRKKFYDQPAASRYYKLTEKEIDLFNELVYKWMNENVVYNLRDKNCVNWAQTVMKEVLNENYTGIGPEVLLNFFYDNIKFYGI